MAKRNFRRKRGSCAMVWGPAFGTVHLLTLAAAALIILALYFLLKKANARLQILVLGVLSFAGIAAIIFNLTACSRWGQHPIEYLPLHLCSVNAILLPIAVFTRSKVVGNMLLLWSLGALFALLCNRPDYELMSDVFCFYYFPHVLEFGIPILLFSLGLIKKDAGCIFSTLVLTFLIYLFVHQCNVFINSMDLINPDGEQIEVNFMYSLVPEVSLLEVFWKIVPHRFWYMLVIFPPVAVYLLVLYIPQIMKKLHRHETFRHKSA